MVSGAYPWLSEIIPIEALGTPLEEARSIQVIEKPGAEMCLACRGARLLCGKERCPIIAKAQSIARHHAPIGSELIQGSSPPGVFVGRFGYPKVYVGPLIPPYFGDTEILDTPERWMGVSLDDILDFRFSLVRGNTRRHVADARVGDRLLETLQEYSMAARPVDSEMSLERRPRQVLTLSEDSQPFGPSAPLRELSASSISVDQRIEKVYNDHQFPASEAVTHLYTEGVEVSRIQKAFSMGVMGIGGNRKLVPTRWSITAVDSTISLDLIERTKDYPLIDEFRVYSTKHLGNIFVGLLLPENWRYESIEAWFPQTTWNQYGVEAALMGDYEGYTGRRTYASIGGCYYAGRLASAEFLCRERRQASVLILREIHPGYILPVGVWNVRESVREMYRTRPRTFSSLDDSLKYVWRVLTIPGRLWLGASVLLKEALFQRRISEYLGT